MTTNSDLLAALENERRYMARELHDGVAQTVLQLGLQGGICRKLFERGHTENFLEQLTKLEERIQLASSQVRELIVDLRRPMVEAGGGLLEYLQLSMKIHHDRGGVKINYRNRLGDNVPPLSAEQILTITRIIQEALLNIRKHAEAKNVLLDLAANEKIISITIADDGKGFDLENVQDRPMDKGGGGLANMYLQAEAIGGKLTISKGTTVGGTAILLTVPLSEQLWW